MRSVNVKPGERFLATVGCLILVMSSLAVSGCTGTPDESISMKMDTAAPDDSLPPANGETLMAKVMNIETPETIYVHNAGMVLTSPFLPRYFSLLGMVQDGFFVSPEAARRGAFLLRYLCCTEESPDYDYTLAKILCGIDPSESLPEDFEVTDQEKEVSQSLLTGLIQNWKAIGNTSVLGLRETFLMREGLLEKTDDSWTLTVEKKGFDVLLDQLPWSYTPIKHSWMHRTIHVKWR